MSPQGTFPQGTPQANLICDFCDGSGSWDDQVRGIADPCPACDGSGQLSRGIRSAPPTPDVPRAAGNANGQRSGPPGSGDILHIVEDLPQGERQRLYEELHRRWNCRIYR